MSITKDNRGTKRRAEESNNDVEEVIEKTSLAREYVALVKKHIEIEAEGERIRKGVFAPAYNWLLQLRTKEQECKDREAELRISVEGRKAIADITGMFSAMLQKALTDKGNAETLEWRNKMLVLMKQRKLYNESVRNLEDARARRQEGEKKVGLLKAKCKAALEVLAEQFEVVRKRENELKVLLGDDFYVSVLEVWCETGLE